MANCVWQLRQDGDQLLYRILGELNRSQNEKYYDRIRIKVPAPSLSIESKKKSKVDDTDSTILLHDENYYNSLLRAYFRMDTDLSECYRQWAAAHKHFESESNKFYAIRVLDQDPVENLFSFICSQNNHISR